MGVPLRSGRISNQAAIAAGLFATMLRAIELGNFSQASRARGELASMGYSVRLPSPASKGKNGGGR